MNPMLSVFVVCAALGQHQKAPGIEQVLKPELELIEKEDSKIAGVDTWIIDEFVFVPPRMITVDIPGKTPSRRLLLYMVYRVTNRGKVERRFVPKFLLVDDRGNSYLDLILPKAQRAIQSREDPLRPLENSITIIRDLKPSTDEADDNSAYGVAIWDATPLPAPPKGQARTTLDPTFNGFKILIEGLSNSVQFERDEQGKMQIKTIKDPVTAEEKVQRKTLFLKFARPGDEFNQNEREIRYLGHEWIYQ